MSQTAAHLVDHVIPHVPVPQGVLSLPIPLRALLAAKPEPVLQVVQRVVMYHMLDGSRHKADEGHGGAVTLIQRFRSTANLNVHLHRLVLDGVYRCGADGLPTFIEGAAPHRRRAARAAADGHHPADEAANAPWRSGPGVGADVPGSARCSLHAAVRVEAHDRKRLEQLCRYIGRPTLSDERV